MSHPLTRAWTFEISRCSLCLILAAWSLTMRGSSLLILIKFTSLSCLKVSTSLKIFVVFGGPLESICLAYHSIFNRRLSRSRSAEAAIPEASLSTRCILASSTTSLLMSSLLLENWLSAGLLYSVSSFIFLAAALSRRPVVKIFLMLFTADFYSNNFYLMNSNCCLWIRAISSISVCVSLRYENLVITVWDHSTVIALRRWSIR